MAFGSRTVNVEKLLTKFVQLNEPVNATNIENSPFIVAELGNNHNGSALLAKELICAAHEAGADAVKFQMRHMDQIYGADICRAKQDLGTQYTFDLLGKFQLSNDNLCEAMDYAASLGMVPLCTPWDNKSVDALEEYGVHAYKLASADLTNYPLISKIAHIKKPILVSTGMSTESEISDVVQYLNQLDVDFILMHCNSTYPAPIKDLNLRYLNKLRRLSGRPVGYSGHERGINAAITAVALGAVVIEKHLTLDKFMEGNDHRASLSPSEFTCLVEAITEVSFSLGNDDQRKLTQGELANRVVLSKSLFATKDLEAGHKVSYDDFVVRSPGSGMQPNKFFKLIGTTLLRPVKMHDPLFESHFCKDKLVPRKAYSFEGKWGIPVRFHDFSFFYDQIKLPLFEFHMSYGDLSLDIDQYMPSSYDSEVVIHAPELFENNHTLDLTALDHSYRQKSIEYLQLTIDVSRDMRKKFKKGSHNVGIVTNVGGFSETSHLSKSETERRLDNLKDSLRKLSLDGVEIWPQTMPPFPWHSGGQRFHNLFTSSQSVVEFCESEGMRVCLDVSHAELVCNFENSSFQAYLDEVLPHTAHLHIADGKGVDGEGLGIGSGSVDFEILASSYRRLAPCASWIVEVWQGHDDGGDGFWRALNELERYGF